MSATPATPNPTGLELGPSVDGASRGRSANVPHAGRRRPIVGTVPRPSPMLLRWFTWYCSGYLRRHFHSLRLSIGGQPPDATGHPLVVYTNHASWWDPIVGLVLAQECFPERRMFAPIDAAMLGRYRMFARLGFFGVEQGTQRGAAQFLRTSRIILRKSNHLLAVTPQGRFADVRDRPLRFQPGLGHLATRVEHALFVPMAAEFVFWEERLPEILVRFGEPLLMNPATCGGRAPGVWSALFEQQLTVTLDALSVEARRRDSSDFRTVLRGGAGQGGIYDGWRSLRARWRGESFAREHGRK